MFFKRGFLTYVFLQLINLCVFSLFSPVSPPFPHLLRPLGLDVLLSPNPNLQGSRGKDWEAIRIKWLGDSSKRHPPTSAKSFRLHGPLICLFNSRVKFQRVL